MSRHLLIDADVLIYESSFGAQRNRYVVTTEAGDVQNFQDAKTRDVWLKEKGLTPEQYTVEKKLDVLEEVAALSICKNKLTALVEKLEATSFDLYITGKGNFREQIATLTPYKGNRVEVEKPVHYQACKDWYCNHANAHYINGQEADDEIGIQGVRHKGQAIICSIDKDLRQLHGRHFEWHKNDGEGIGFNINPDASDRWFWLQMLMGDSADNIPGIPRIGPKRAEKLLEPCTTRQDRADVVAAQFAKLYGPTWKQWADEIGALLWIRRAKDQMFKWDDYLAGRMIEA